MEKMRDKKSYETHRKQLTKWQQKFFLISNCFKCKWINLHNKTYMGRVDLKNMIQKYAVYKRFTLNIKTYIGCLSD